MTINWWWHYICIQILRQSYRFFSYTALIIPPYPTTSIPIWDGDSEGQGGQGAKIFRMAPGISYKCIINAIRACIVIIYIIYLCTYMQHQYSYIVVGYTLLFGLSLPPCPSQNDAVSQQWLQGLAFTQWLRHSPRKMAAETCATTHLLPTDSKISIWDEAASLWDSGGNSARAAFTQQLQYHFDHFGKRLMHCWPGADAH